MAAASGRLALPTIKAKRPEVAATHYAMNNQLNYIRTLKTLLKKKNPLFSQKRDLIQFRATLILLTEHKCLDSLSELMALFLCANKEQQKLIEEICLPWLQFLPSNQIYQLDEKLRSSISYSDLNSPLITKPFTDYSFFALCILICHPNGHIREGAISAISNHAEPLSLVFALIRCNDWVSSIREEAKDTAFTLIQIIDPAALMDLWDLFVRSSLGQRHQGLDLVNTLFILLHQRIPKKDLLHQLKSNSSKTRRYTAEIMWHNDDELDFSDIEALCNCSDPYICFKTIRTILPKLDQAARTQLLNQIKRKKWAPARLERLRLLVSDDKKSMKLELVNALSDRSPSIRNFARFHLKNNQRINIEQHYQKIVTSEQISTRIIALQGLHEIGSSLSANLALDFLYDINPRIVATALSILPETSIQPHESFILEKLMDDSIQVNKAAYSALCKNPPHTDKILPLLNASNVNQKHSFYLASLLLLQTQWRSVTSAIWLSRHHSNDLKQMGVSWLKNWVSGYRRPWTQPSQNDLNRIHKELSHSLPFMDERLVEEFHFLINSYK